MELTGHSFIGGHRGAPGSRVFSAVNPATGADLQPAYYCAASSEVDEAAQLASDAFASYSQAGGAAKAVFLRRIADGFEAHREELAQRAHLETALPIPRLLGEVGRTAGQLRLFAGVVEDG